MNDKQVHFHPVVRVHTGQVLNRPVCSLCPDTVIVIQVCLVSENHQASEPQLQPTALGKTATSLYTGLWCLKKDWPPPGVTASPPPPPPPFCQRPPKFGLKVESLPNVSPSNVIITPTKLLSSASILNSSACKDAAPFAGPLSVTLSLLCQMWTITDPEVDLHPPRRHWSSAGCYRVSRDTLETVIIIKCI